MSKTGRHCNREASSRARGDKAKCSERLASLRHAHAERKRFKNHRLDDYE